MDISKKGFLKKDFDIFYINDRKSYEFEYHFHEFHKIIIFLRGKVNYIVDGRAHNLEPFDILFVRNNEVHKPEIDPNFQYERIVIWINDTNIIKEDGDVNLLECFELKDSTMLNQIRLGDDLPENFRFVIAELKNTFKREDSFGQKSLRRVLFIQLMIYINRKIISETDSNSIKKYASCDKTIQKAIDYITANIKNELKVENIAEILFVSKYHLMRKFKLCTGFTLHSFILKKRLIHSRELMKNGRSAYSASVESGFTDYSTFIRGYKKVFKELPSKFKK